METKICKSCNKVKPLYAYYKANRSGKKRYDSSCIRCASDQRKLAYEAKKDASVRIIDGLPVFTYNHYLLTVVDDMFNEFTGTISARVHFQLNAEFLGLDSFMMDDKRLFYEAKVDKMSINEYYDIHDKHQKIANFSCPNLTISKFMSKKETKRVLHEFLTALYFYHKEC
jgi:hypothetical protein